MQSDDFKFPKDSNGRDDLTVYFSDSFEIYNSVWCVVNLTPVVLSGDDRLIGILKEHNVISRLDADHLRNRSFDIPSNDTGSLFCQVHFLTLLK